MAQLRSATTQVWSVNLVGGELANFSNSGLVESGRVGRRVGDSRLSDRWSGVDPADLADSGQVRSGRSTWSAANLPTFSESGQVRLVGSAGRVGDGRLTD